MGKKSNREEIELGLLQKPEKLREELYHLITANPRDPAFLQASQKLAEKYVIH